MKNLSNYIEDLKNPNKKTRIKAVQELRRIGMYEKDGRNKVIPYLISTLKDSDEDVQLEAVIGLKDLDAYEAIDELIAILQEPDKYNDLISSHAAYALKRIGDPKAVDILLKSLNNPLERIRGAAAIALGEFNEPRVIETLMDLFYEEYDEDVFIDIISSLGQLHAVEMIIPILEELEYVEDSTTHWYLIRSLCNMCECNWYYDGIPDSDAIIDILYDFEETTIADINSIELEYEIKEASRLFADHLSDAIDSYEDENYADFADNLTTIASAFIGSYYLENRGINLRRFSSIEDLFGVIDDQVWANFAMLNYFASQDEDYFLSKEEEMLDSELILIASGFFKIIQRIAELSGFEITEREFEKYGESELDMLMKELIMSTDRKPKQLMNTIESYRKDAVDPLINLLENPESPWSMVYATELLGKIRDEKAIDLLIDLLYEEWEVLQSAAIDALIRIGTPSIKPLSEHLFNPEVDESEKEYKLLAICEVLENIRNEESFQVLLKATKEIEDENIRATAGASLAEFEDVRAIEPLREIWNTCSPEARAEIIEGLIELCERYKVDIPELPELKKEQERIERETSEFLNNIETELTNINNAIDNLIEKLEKDIESKKKIGRNDPCPCGSGIKYKKCCGKKVVKG
ncbi:MAG: HEAT repeat domain-containing protein [Methanosarcinales archaeon]